MNLLILHDDLPTDARADELDVLVQAKAVGAALDQLGHSWSARGVSLDLAGLADQLERDRPDLVINLVESLGRRMSLAHAVPALLDGLHIPYTGVPTEGLFLTNGKVLAKRWLAASGIPTPAWVEASGLVSSGRCPQDPGATEDTRFAWRRSRGSSGPARSESFSPARYIIKSVHEHASLGLDDDSIINARRIGDVRRAILERADRLGGEAFAEEYIEGREFNLALLDRALDATSDRAATLPVEVLAPAEILFEGYAPGKPRIVGYAAKWAEDSFEYNKTPRRFDFPPEDLALVAKLSELALRCWAAFGLRGYARVDFRVDASDRPFVLEINANPCLSPDAGFMAAAARTGMDYRDVVDRLVRAALSSRGARSSISRENFA